MTGVFAFSKWIVSLAIAGLVLLALYEKPCQQSYPTNVVFEPQFTAVTPLVVNKESDDDDLCLKDFYRITRDMDDLHVSGNDARIPGVTEEDLERSIAHVGNRFRLAYFIDKLKRSSSVGADISQEISEENSGPVTVIVCGGSISLGHGVNPRLARYSDLLENWLNLAYPVSANHSLSNENESKHRVYNRGSHGADVRSALICL